MLIIAQENYTITEEELFAIVFFINKSHHSTLKYLLNGNDAKLRLIWWVRLHKEFSYRLSFKVWELTKIANYGERYYQFIPKWTSIYT